MRTIIALPFTIYIIAGIACLCIMVIIDYLLGPEAEHLNAWVILNRVVGNDIGIADSLAIRKLGLGAAFILMLVINLLFGSVLILLLKGIIRLFHS
jgi:hypothetical protein